MRYINESQTAAFLGLAVRTLRNWRYVGQGPPFYRIGGAVRYEQDEVATWALAQRDSRPTTV